MRNKTVKREKDRWVIQSHSKWLIVNVRKKSTHGVALEWNTALGVRHSFSLARASAALRGSSVRAERTAGSATHKDAARERTAKRCTCNPRCSLADVRIV